MINICRKAVSKLFKSFLSFTKPVLPPMASLAPLGRGRAKIVEGLPITRYSLPVTHHPLLSFVTRYSLPSLSRFFGITLLFFIGCASPYKPTTQVLPQNIKKVSIETFKNSTVYYGIEDKLTTAVTNEFIRDGRLAVVNPDEADGVLFGEITRYVLEPLTYDENHVVKEYKLWILVNISLIDKARKVVLWQEKNLEGNYRFFIANLPGGTTEEEAREIIWDKLSRNILKRTIEGFGAVSGISEKKVPPKTE